MSSVARTLSRAPGPRLGSMPLCLFDMARVNGQWIHPASAVETTYTLHSRLYACSFLVDKKGEFLSTVHPATSRYTEGSTTFFCPTPIHSLIFSSR